MSHSKMRKSKAMKPGKSRGKGLLVFLAIVIVVLAVVGYVMSQPARRAGSIGDNAPDFTLRVVDANGLSDQSVTLSSLRGKVVVLEFMVSWCHVCQQMAPSVEYLNYEYNGQGVVFISVAGTQNGATAESTADFIKQYQSTWTYLLDTDNSVFSTYGVEATPTFFILDKSGVILSRMQGTIATDAMSDAIARALS